MVISGILYWIIFGIYTLLLIALVFYLMKRLKISMKKTIPLSVLFGLIIGAGSFGYITISQGTHFVVVKSDLSNHFYYSFGATDYKMSDGKTVHLDKFNNYIVNDTDKNMLFEKVIYGSTYEEGGMDPISPYSIYECPTNVYQIYYFDNRPPGSIESQKSGEVKYWLYVHDDDLPF